MASVFDPEAFKNTPVDGAMDTALTPVPPNRDVPGQIESYKVRQNEKDGEVWTVMDVVWHILDEESKKVTGLDKPFCRQSIFLDLTAENNLDNGKAKNVQLGKLRDAIGQNKAGKPWHPDMILGAMGLCHIEPDKGDPENYSRVTRVAKAA